MRKTGSHLPRRGFLGAMALGTSLFTTRGLLAEMLTATAPQTEGPFYPDRLPLDTDNDLLVVNDGVTPAVGEITHLTGRVLSAAGEPIRNAVVEIWQADSQGIYAHSRCPNTDERDKNFQGFGRFLTDSSGQYYFRTIRPVSYMAGVAGAQRTPHIHFIVERSSQRLLTTQMYIADHPLNEQDFIFRSIKGAEAKQSVLVPFEPVPGSKIGEQTANFDIVLGTTPEDPEG